MIGWYVHHHGRGHLHRAAAIAAELDAPVTALSSTPGARDVLPPDVGLVPLDRDDDPAPTGFPDPTAGGALHWAPLRHPGHRARLARIAAWIDEHDPAALVVDVSVEVAALGRLLGVPVVVGGMPGVREDAPHQLAHRLAVAVLAPWPDWVPPAPHLREHTARLHRVGGISRFSGRVPVAAPDDGRERIVVLGGAGGSDAATGYWARVREVVTARRDAEVTILGGPDGRWADDPWPLLTSADLVVTHAGQNAVADVAAAGTRAVVVAETRPFDEQRATGRVLAGAGLATTLDELPEPDAWPALVAAALEADATETRTAWRAWQTDGAAARAAAVVSGVAAGVTGL